jgi:hypothetical protein
VHCAYVCLTPPPLPSPPAGEEDYTAEHGDASTAAQAAAAAAAADAGAGARGGAAPAVVGVDVVTPFALRSADDLATPWTNYTSGYRGLLDYVWYEPARLAVARQLPMPAEQLLASFIPSPVFPSDHLAVGYDFVFRAGGGEAPPGAAAAASGDARAAAAAVAAGVQQPAAPAGALAVHDPATFVLLPALEDHAGDAVAALRRGEVVVLPLDGQYALAVAAGDAAAAERLQRVAVRGRAEQQGQPQAQPVLVVAAPADVGRYCRVEGLPAGLVEALLLPGQVTLLLAGRPDAQLPGSSGAAGEAAAPLLGCIRARARDCREGAHEGAH